MVTAIVLGGASAATGPAGTAARPAFGRECHPHRRARTGRIRGGLKQRGRKVITLALRQLLRFVREYPLEPVLGAVQEAARYGLYDLDRLERMILRRVTREYFLLDREPQEDE
jgi:hypothetical protein